MNVYDIDTGITFSQTHSVVAGSIGLAEKLFKKRFPYTTIQRIVLHSEEVTTEPKKDLEERKRIMDIES